MLVLRQGKEKGRDGRWRRRFWWVGCGRVWWVLLVVVVVANFVWGGFT